MRPSDKLFFAFLLLCVQPVHAQAAVRPGLWELSQRTEIGGNKNAKPIVSHFCIEANQADNPRAWIPRFHVGGSCNTRDYVSLGNEANWKFVCQGEPAMTGTSHLRIGPEQYEGSNNMELRRGNERMNVVQIYVGRRIGDCEGQRTK